MAILSTNEALAQDVSESVDEVERTSLNNLTTIVAIVSAFGVIGALVFNGITQLKEKKKQHYEIFKDLITEFVEIEDKASKLMDYMLMTTQQLNQYPIEIQYEVGTYRWKYLAFHDKIAHLALIGIIPKDVAGYYSLTFSSALLYMELEPNPELAKENYNYIIEWCKKENIEKSQI